MHGSESVAVNPSDGSLWMLDKFGFVFRARSTDNETGLERFAFVGPGRPLGFHQDLQGRLLICNSLQGGVGRSEGERGRKVALPLLLLGCHGSARWPSAALAIPVAHGPAPAGLQRLDPASGALETLANRVSDDSPLAPGSVVTYANDLDVSPAGDVYFSDSSDIPPALNRHPSEGGW